MDAVVSYTTCADAAPWKDLSLRGRIEAEFLRPLYLGESVAPFRLLEPALAVIPWDDETGQLLDSARAYERGFPELGQWLRRAEELWEAHKASDMSLLEQIDYYGKLVAQFPIPASRLVYAASGSVPAAAILPDPDAVVEHNLYWASLPLDEARYLEALLNSDVVAKRLQPLQARGQWGPRHVDKYILQHIPRFNPSNTRHAALVQSAQRAEQIAAAVALRPGIYFVRARQLIREALQEAGIAKKIDKLAAKVLG